MKKMLDSLPSGLRVVTNFGLVDICPERSGKHNAAAYLAKEHFGIPLADCASMGDDDNDIALVSKSDVGGGTVWGRGQVRYVYSLYRWHQF